MALRGKIMKNKNTMSKMEIKNKKVMLYLTKAVILLNYRCNNIIKEEKFQRAITMFMNRFEDYETIKTIIDWHVQNETKQYLQSLKDKKMYLNRKSQSKNKVLKIK